MRGPCLSPRQRQDDPPKHLVGQHHLERGRSLENFRIRFLPSGKPRREKVTTTKTTASKTKKNIEKFVNHHYIESLHLSDHLIENQKSKTVKNYLWDFPPMRLG